MTARTKTGLPNFSDYFSKLKISNDERKRIESLYTIFGLLTSEEIKDIFVTDIVDANGNPTRDDLWIFSQMLAMQAKYFKMPEYFVKLLPLHHNISNCEFKTQGYQFEAASSAARMEVTFTLHAQAMYILRATGQNCEDLKRVLTTYLIPNLRIG